MLDHRHDERFETYLRKFRPQVPDPLPAREMKRASRPHFGLTIWAAGCALTVAILLAATLRIVSQRRAEESHHAAAVKLTVSTPLTMRRANDLLAAAPSYKDLMNQLTFPSNSPLLPKDKQSALAVLSKEKIKL